MDKRKISKLERLIVRAEAAYIKQSLSTQAVERAIKYVGFEKDGGSFNTPDLSIASGGEVILSRIIPGRYNRANGNQRLYRAIRFSLVKPLI